MPNGWGHGGHAYRTLWKIVMSPRPLTCWLCSRTIDHTLRYPDPGSKALHCIQPVSKGGTLAVFNCVPTHRSCNLKQGNKLTYEGPFANRQEWVEGLEP